MKRRLSFLTALCLIAAPAHARGLKTLDGRPLTPDGIARKVEALMAAGDVKGLGVAIIRDGRVVYRRSFGLRNVAERRPLEPDTILYGASLTKATFAYMVMQLVDEGRVDLDRPIAAYLPKPLPSYAKFADLAGDARWRRLTHTNLHDHTRGIA